MANIHIDTYGCTANQHDAEIMTGLLQEEGHIITSTEDADTLIINICTVKGDKKAIREITDARKKNPEKRIIVTGCTTQLVKDQSAMLDPDIQVLSTHYIDQIGELLRGKKPKDPHLINKIKLPRISTNPVVGIVLICEGCTNVCSYCSTKLIKGTVRSYPMEDIVKSVESLVYQGKKEIWLTSQDNGAYGIDLYKRYAFAELIQKIGAIRGTFSLRIGMANPHHLKRLVPDLIPSLHSKNILRFLHIPVQSGSDRILKKMNRTYTSKEYTDLINTLKKEVPQITLSTDVIVGFPTETEEDFQETLAIVEKTRPPVMNISRYAIREGTKAALMPQVPDWIKKERSRKLTALFHRIAKEENKKWVGWEGTVLIDEKGTKGTMKGRNSHYKPVILKGKHQLGDIVRVRITGSTIFDLLGEPV